MVRSVPRAKRRLEQIGGIAGAGRSAGANQGMGFVDEQDDGGRRLLHLVDHRTQTLFELALHRRTGLHQADVERAQLHAAQRRRNVAGRNALREALDHRGLADAGVAGEDRIVLAPPHQHIDDLADFLVAAQDRIHIAGLRLGGEILGEAIKRGGAFRPRCLLGARRTGSAQARAVHRPQVLFLRARPDLAIFGGEEIDR